jgi:hypothetical protein
VELAVDAEEAFTVHDGGRVVEEPVVAELAEAAHDHGVTLGGFLGPAPKRWTVHGFGAAPRLLGRLEDVTRRRELR